MKRFLFVLMLIPMLGFTQANYHKGYVVTNSNDTLKGFIDYKERSRSPETVNFKSDLAGNSQKFTLSDIVAYGIEDLECFRRFVVNISTGEIKVSDLKIGPDLSFRRDTVFLKVLQTGKNLALFSYTDDLKDRFYVLKTGGKEPVELARNVYLADNGVGLIHDDKYIRQLDGYIKTLDINEKITDRQLLSLKYNENALLKIAARINELNEQQISKDRPKGNRFFAGIGLLSSRVKYIGNHELASPAARVKRSHLPMAGLGFDFFANPAIRRSIFRTELLFQMSKSDISLISEKVTEASYHHSFDRMTIVLSPQYIYNILNGVKIKVFAGTGAGLNFSKISKNESVLFYQIGDEMRVNDQERKVEWFNYNLLLFGGVVFHKRIELSAGYSPNSVIINYSTFMAEVNQFRFGLNYLFGKH